MSYIAFDLDALNAAPAVARAAGMREDEVIAGLVRLWAWCFREKTDRVTQLQIRGHLGADACEALAAFGFLEKQPDEQWRVRGADRYLRVSEARSRGGKAAASNLVPGGKRKRTNKSPSRASVSATPSAAAELQPSASLGSTSALTPSTEHRAPNTILETSASAASQPAQPRASDLLVEDFETVVGKRYGWNGAKDGVALAWCLSQAPLEEVRARWRAGLRVPPDKWLSVRTVAQLRSKWNDLAKLPVDLSGDWRSRVDHSADFFAGVGG